MRASPLHDSAASHDAGLLHPEALNELSRVDYLPLVTLYLTERCNSRCVSCDYWRHGRVDLNLAAVRRLLPSLTRLRTKIVLISGGEPLLNPEWAEIAQLLSMSGIQCWLLTSGLSLAKHARRAAESFNAITVSLDGSNRETYATTRGLDAFDKVCAGIRAASATGVPVAVRVTVQRANFGQLPRFVELARELGARQISFLAVDVSNPHAFGRVGDISSQLALQLEDLPVLEEILNAIEVDYAEDFRTRFIAESPARLRKMHRYFSAVCGLGPYPAVHCNAPEFSAVIDSSSRVRPCFFIPGPAAAICDGDGDVEKVLNSNPMTGLRQDIRAGRRAECGRCVCSLWRDPGSAISDFILGYVAADA